MRAEFTDDLITGNELIDSQHEELIGRINKLLDSCEAGEGKNKCNKDVRLPCQVHRHTLWR